ncbi:MAG TPA: VWA domain-containing protein [Saprospiraceae bacterium]|nr:VWA domain-containing protein [Saprospiraceae bacterium]
MQRFLSLFLLLSLMAFTHPVTQNTPPSKPKIQVALMLDTSNSMDGLIDQAKSQLWKMVNELATAKQNDQIPDIEIALYEYGNDGLSGREGFVRQVSNLTTDLDKISEELFALKTNGGSEYCGWVIKDGVHQLDWDSSDKTLKIIFIAGNEPFDQGPKDYRKSCKNAIEQGIIINTIFCGSYQSGINSKWQDGAYLAEGKYFNIDPNVKETRIPTPFDTTIIRLNSELNKTYIGFNQQAVGYKSRQTIQDANAASMSVNNMRERAAFKSKKQYNNASWDLVDAYEKDDKVLDEVEEEVLPEDLKNLTKQELKDKIQALKEERAQILKKLKDTESKARKYEEKVRQSTPQAEKNTLDKAMMKAIKSQAKKKNYHF